MAKDSKGQVNNPSTTDALLPPYQLTSHQNNNGAK